MRALPFLTTGLKRMWQCIIALLISTSLFRRGNIKGLIQLLLISLVKLPLAAVVQNWALWVPCLDALTRSRGPREPQWSYSLLYSLPAIISPWAANSSIKAKAGVSGQHAGKTRILPSISFEHQLPPGEQQWYEYRYIT